MKHFIFLISKRNMYASKAVPQMCWKWSFLRGPGTSPKRMSLVLGSVEFTVAHGLCCFMGLSTSQFLQGNSALLDTQNHILLGGITLCKTSFETACTLFIKDLSKYCMSVWLSVCALWDRALVWGELLVLVQIKVRNKIAVSPAKMWEEIKRYK